MDVPRSPRDANRAVAGEDLPHRYLTEIVHRRPRQWYEDVDRLHQILQSHGPEVLRRAMEEGLKQQIYGALYVERSLQPELSFPQVVP
jgi:hypothetical protein